jgi:hypothetical protein
MKISLERVLEGVEIILDLQISRQHFRNVRCKQPFLESLLKASSKDTPALSKQTRRVYIPFSKPNAASRSKVKRFVCELVSCSKQKNFLCSGETVGADCATFPFRSRERGWVAAVSERRHTKAAAAGFPPDGHSLVSLFPSGWPFGIARRGFSADYHSPQSLSLRVLSVCCVCSLSNSGNSSGGARRQQQIPCLQQLEQKMRVEWPCNWRIQSVKTADFALIAARELKRKIAVGFSLLNVLTSRWYSSLSGFSSPET